MEFVFHPNSDVKIEYGYDVYTGGYFFHKETCVDVTATPYITGNYVFKEHIYIKGLTLTELTVHVMRCGEAINQISLVKEYLISHYIAMTDKESMIPPHIEVLLKRVANDILVNWAASLGFALEMEKNA